MSDLKQLLHLWQQIELSGEDCVLATVVRVEGSSYRKPGARMLISRSGVRAGTISGGCLEGEVSKQAWWLTEQGPVVKAYSTSFEMDEDRPFGLGCGGTVHLLLERRRNAELFLKELLRAFESRQPLACAVVLARPDCGKREVVSPGTDPSDVSGLRLFAAASLQGRRSSLEDNDRVWAEYIPARTGLLVLGAGDDAKPLVAQASTLGWHITVADGRSHLATQPRFPEADEVVVLEAGSLEQLKILEGDAAVVMTHSYEQDRSVLKHLIEANITYLGVLGPRYRTADLMTDVKADLALSRTELGEEAHPHAGNAIYSPVGLELGGDSPATIALSIVAQIQGVISGKVRQGEHFTLQLSNEPLSFAEA